MEETTSDEGSQCGMMYTPRARRTRAQGRCGRRRVCRRRRELTKRVKDEGGRMRGYTPGARSTRRKGWRASRQRREQKGERAWNGEGLQIFRHACKSESELWPHACVRGRGGSREERKDERGRIRLHTSRQAYKSERVVFWMLRKSEHVSLSATQGNLR